MLSNIVEPGLQVMQRVATSGLKGETIHKLIAWFALMRCNMSMVQSYLELMFNPSVQASKKLAHAWL